MTKSTSSKLKPAAPVTTVHPVKAGRKRVAAVKPSESSTVVAPPKSSSPDRPKKSSAARPVAERKTKLVLVVEMLRTKRGVSADEIAKATGWQRHTVRGAIAGAIKRKLGLKVVTEDRDGIRIYRIVGR